MIFDVELVPSVRIYDAFHNQIDVTRQWKILIIQKIYDNSWSFFGKFRKKNDLKKLYELFYYKRLMKTVLNSNILVFSSKKPIFRSTSQTTVQGATYYSTILCSALKITRSIIRFYVEFSVQKDQEKPE